MINFSPKLISFAENILFFLILYKLHKKNLKMTLKLNKFIKFSSYLLFLFFIFSVNSCSENNKNIYPAAIGKQGNLLLVMSNNAWKKAPGKVLRKLLAKDVICLPQSEPEFRISQMPASAFSDMFKRTRNIFIAKISSKIKKSSFVIFKNKWSAPQIVVSIQANNYDDFVKIFNENSTKIFSVFINAEKERIIKSYSKQINPTTAKILKEKFNISISIPKRFELYDQKENFCWLRYETQELSQAILIWDYPYKDTSELKAKQLIAMRDSITKMRIPGPLDNSYMTTEKKATFDYNNFMFKNRYNVIMKGLWKLENAFMGGPYVSITTIDEKRNRIITVDGFVYAGKKDKRNYIRQLEAILYTLDIKN